jgi:cyclophilin family peptidyl-prolyl cis-trans isomerase
VDAQKKKKAVVKSKTTAVKKMPAKPKQIAKPKTAAPVRIKIQTDSGTMIVRLYDSTPLHRDNFLKLVTAGFYDSLMFHRVIPEFMIQGGDPLSKNAPPMTPLGSGGGDMDRIPAEFRPTLRHKRGVLAAARDNNPEKASSACQFYIVQGKVMNDAELDMIENRKGIKYTAAEREIYKTIGGTPFLDMEYTVFGEVESGYEVIDKIANVARDAGNRPNGDVRMYMQVVK